MNYRQSPVRAFVYEVVYEKSTEMIQILYNLRLKQREINSHVCLKMTQSIHIYTLSLTSRRRKQKHFKTTHEEHSK